MSSQSAQPKKHKKIPLSVVFMTLGLIIIASIVMILLVSPYRLPERYAQYTELALTQIPFAIELDESEISAANDLEDRSPVFLPESPSASVRFPSVATVAEAPKSNLQSISNQPRRLVIPSLEIDVNVNQVSLVPQEKDGQKYYQWQVPAGFEAGWHDNSAPLGQAGNTVLNGHNNVHGEVFRNLVDLSIGEKIILYDDENSYSYEIVQQEILPEQGQPISVRRLNARWIESTRDERITIVSCWPYATNSHRLIVVAKPVEEQ